MRIIVLGILLFLGQDRFSDKIAEGAHGIVATESPPGAEAGIPILERGGNAVDAAVATAFAMGVSLPSHSGMGGRSQLLVVMRDGRSFHIDGGTEVPALSSEEADVAGWKSICVPGSVAALAMAHKEGGSLPWKEVVAPAIEMAKRRSKTEALVATLEAVAGDPQAFYTGRIAGMIDEEMQARGGFVRKSDLAAYKAVKREALRSTYRGHDVFSCDRPSSGLCVIETLNILETFNFAKREAVDSEHILIESLRLAFEDRQKKWDDSKVRVETLLSKEHAKKRAAEVDLGKAGEPKLSHDSDGDTTHISVVDAEGNACAFTQSLGPWFGAGQSKACGFYWNATQGHVGRVAAGKRHTTGQSPTILVRDGRPVLIVGSAGEMRIISAVAQTVHRVIDRGMSLRDAVFAPRWHWEGPRLTVESRVAARELSFPKEIFEALAKRGFSSSAMPSSPHFGRVQAIVWDSERKTYTGVADPRGGGAARAAADRRKRRRRGMACPAAQ